MPEIEPNNNLAFTPIMVSEAPMSCPNCGGTLLGDGVTTVVHCEFTDPLGLEPDANPVYCTPRYVLENWSITPNSQNPYLAPELKFGCLQGLRDGRLIITSKLRGKTLEGHIRTLNSIYVLGTVDPQYEVEFHNAHTRLLDSLPLIEEPT